MNINETIAEVLRLNREATPGPWYEQSGDDEYHMGAIYVGTADDLDTSAMANGCEANDVVAITLLQHPRLANVRDKRWGENADLIAYYRTAAPALAREVQRLQAELSSTQRAHDCAIATAYESGHRAGQEAMRERCLQACEDIILFSRSAEGIHLSVDMLCMRSHLFQAVRALEVER